MYVEAPSRGVSRLMLLQELDATPWWRVLLIRRIHRDLDRIDAAIERQYRANRLT